MLFLCTPGGFENLVREMSVPAERRTLPPPSDEEPDWDHVARVREGERLRAARVKAMTFVSVSACGPRSRSTTTSSPPRASLRERFWRSPVIRVPAGTRPMTPEMVRRALGDD